MAYLRFNGEKLKLSWRSVDGDFERYFRSVFWVCVVREEETGADLACARFWKGYKGAAGQV